MSALSPKAEFQRHEDVKKELAKVVASNNWQFSLTFALAQWSMTFRPTPEQIIAVDTFLATLANLPEQDRPMPVFPTRTLDQSAYEPRRPETSKPK